MTWSVLPLPKAPREAAAQRRPADVSGQPRFFRKTSDRMVCNARRPHWKCLDAGRSPQPCETTCHIGRPQAPPPIRSLFVSSEQTILFPSLPEDSAAGFCLMDAGCPVAPARNRRLVAEALQGAYPHCRTKGTSALSGPPSRAP